MTAEKKKEIEDFILKLPDAIVFDCKSKQSSMQTIEYSLDESMLIDRVKSDCGCAVADQRLVMKDGERIAAREVIYTDSTDMTHMQADAYKYLKYLTFLFDDGEPEMISARGISMINPKKMQKTVRLQILVYK